MFHRRRNLQVCHTSLCKKIRFFLGEKMKLTQETENERNRAIRRPIRLIGFMYSKLG